MWTHFWDMHSGGGQKEDYAHIYIEAPEEQAKTIFYNRFGHNPERVSCTCCGQDYSISEYKTLEEATEYHRKEQFRIEYRKNTKVYLDYDSEKVKPVSIEKYEDNKDISIIYKRDIRDDEKIGEVPQQGYVWAG